MAKIGDADFVGVSGKKYAFGVYSSDTTFKDIGAVYIFSKRTESQGKGSHSFLYIGETGRLGTRISGHEKWPCVKQHGVNCICVCAENHQNSRLDTEADLRMNKITPCND